MAVNAFVSFFDKADGESIQKGKEKWVEIQGWDWEVEADTSWTKGGGASVGKPNPGKLNARRRQNLQLGHPGGYGVSVGLTRGRIVEA